MTLASLLTIGLPTRSMQLATVRGARARQTQASANRSTPPTADARRVRGRDGHPAALHEPSPHGAGVVAAAAFTLPALGFALGPIFSREPFNWQTIGPPADFTETTYSTKVITIVQGIGEAGKSIAYVRTRNPAIDTEPEDQYNHCIALSSRCMHLGCPVRYVAAAAALHLPVPRRRLRLPREVAGGPPVRPLDRFYTRLNATTAASRSARATRSTPSCSGSRRATRASRSTASASTCTRRASTPRSRRPTLHAQAPCPRRSRRS